jgi:hypothetical protein
MTSDEPLSGLLYRVDPQHAPAPWLVARALVRYKLKRGLGAIHG